MYSINGKLAALQPYDPITGSYDVRLDANESCLSLPDNIKKSVLEAMMTVEYNRYPDPYAERLCSKFAEYYGVPSEFVTAGNGSDELIGVIIASFLQKGEKILTFDKDFSMYGFYGYLYENEVVKQKKNADLSINVDEVLETLKDKSIKAVIFSNPCNPTSLGLAREEVRKIITSTEALVVLDEAYMDFWNQSLLSEVGQYDNLIILRTCSKAIGLAAVRLGFAVANERLTNALRAAKSPYNVNALSQAAGTAVLEEKELLKERCGYLINQRRKLNNALTEKGYEIFDSCTNFVLLKTENAKELHSFLLTRSIAVRLMGTYLRISAGTDEELRRLMEGLDEYEKSRA